MSFFTGTPGKYKQISTLEKGQMPLKNQLFRAGQGQGAGGAFGDAADYYRSLLNENNSTYDALAAPEMRQFREQTIPGLSEQFAGMGFGGAGLESSGFRNAAVGAGTDLAERLGAIRAQLRQQGAAGLQGIGQAGLQQFNENVYQPPTSGFLEQAAPIAGAALGAFGGPALDVLGKTAGNWLSNKFGNSSPAGAENNSPNAAGNPSWKGPASPQVNVRPGKYSDY
jgi:hypothetical protein